MYPECNENMALTFFFYQRLGNLYALYHQKQGNYHKQINFEDISNQKQGNMNWSKIWSLFGLTKNWETTKNRETCGNY